MNRNYVNALDRLTDAYETIGAHNKKPGAAWLVQASQAHMLAAIHDEQRTQTGLLTDLRGAIDDLAEALRPKGDPCPCGCRRDVEATEDEPCGYACNSIYAGCPVHDPEATPTPEPESVTVTLPRDVVDVAWARLEVAASDPAASQEYATRHGAAADALLAALDAANTPKSATDDDLSAPQPSEAPADGECAERPTAANLGRIGWMRPSMSEPWFLVHEAPDGWSEDSTNDALWFADEQPDAIFTPLTPADFGWTVLADDEVAVKRAIAAEALREAADNYSDFETFIAGDGHPAIRKHRLRPDQWLRARADGLEAGR